MEFTIDYNGFNFLIEGNLYQGETSHDYDLPDTPADFEIESISIEGQDGDAESILSKEALREIREQAVQYAINQ